MQKRLYSFLDQHDILFKNQFGFRKNNSTTYALIDLTEQIKESIDNKKYCSGVFIDIRKAFDTVNHNILLKKLDHYGIRGVGLKWFKSYLSNRWQYVETRFKIEAKFSVKIFEEHEFLKPKFTKNVTVCLII